MKKTGKFLTQTLDANKCVLECVQWQDSQQREMFAYVLMKKNRLADFKKQLNERDIDLTHFGVVVAYGSGAEPPQGLEQNVLNAISTVA